MGSTLFIAVLTISATAVGFVISTIVNWYVSLSKDKLAYKNEYYKRLIEKRFSAYESIESVLRNMQKIIHTEDPDWTRDYDWFVLFDSRESFDEFLNSVLSCSVAAWWLSKEMIGLISSFSQFLQTEIRYKANDVNLVALGMRHHKKIKEYYFQIERILFNDLKNLHEVENFIKNIPNHPYS